MVRISGEPPETHWHGTLAAAAALPGPIPSGLKKLCKAPSVRYVVSKPSGGMPYLMWRIEQADQRHAESAVEGHHAG